MMKKATLLAVFCLMLVGLAHADTNNCLSYAPSEKSHYVFNGILSETNQYSLEGATVTLFNVSTNKVEVVYKNLNEYHFQFKLYKGSQYEITIEREGYFSRKIQANVDMNGCVICFESLGKVQPGLVEDIGTDARLGVLKAHIQLRKVALTQRIKIDDVYFGVNEVALDNPSKAALGQFATILKDNPKVIVEVGVHTDQRGERLANRTLSQRRAELIIEYLTELGVNKTQLVAVGYGCDLPVVNCTPCTEDQHQQNRRVDFIVTRYYGNLDEADALSSTVPKEASSYAFGAFGEAVEVTENPDNATIAQQQTVVPFNNTKDFNVRPAVAAAPASYHKVATNPSPKDEDPVFAVANDELTFKGANIDPAQNSERSGEMAFGSASTGEPESLIFTNTRAKRVEEACTGYKVEILSTEVELNDGHFIFETYRGIFHDVNEDGYSYMLGSFISEEAAQAFLKNVVLEKHPQARVIRYKKGKRLN